MLKEGGAMPRPYAVKESRARVVACGAGFKPAPTCGAQNDSEQRGVIRFGASPPLPTADALAFQIV